MEHDKAGAPADTPTPQHPPSPWDDLRALRLKLESKLRGLFGRFGWLPAWVKMWAGLGLFAWAVAMIQIAEFALAQILFCLAAVAFLVQIYHWEIPLKSGLAKVAKGGFALALVIAFVLSTIINIKIKGAKAWSNLWAEEQPAPIVEQRPAPVTPPLTVSPKVINLYTSKGTAAEQEIFIHNSASVAYYSVLVKVTIKSPIIKPANVEISPSKVLEVGGPTPGDAIDRLDAMNFTRHDAKTNSLSFDVRRIGPNSTVRHILRRAEMELSAADKHEAIINIEGASLEPPTVEAFHKDGGDFIVTPSSGTGVFVSKPEDHPNVVLIHYPITDIYAGGKPAVSFILKNTGSKDALRHEATARLMWREGGAQESQFPKGIKTHSRTITAGTTVGTILRIGRVGQEWVDKFKAGALRPYLKITGEYFDDKGRRYEYDYCRTFDPINGNWVPCPS